MTTKRPLKPTWQPMIVDQDKPRYESLRQGIIRLLMEREDYQPAIDDPLVDRIASLLVYIDLVQKRMDKSRSPAILTSLVDALAKLNAQLLKTAETVAMNRKERLRQKLLGQTKDELTERMYALLEKSRHGKP